MCILPLHPQLISNLVCDPQALCQSAKADKARLEVLELDIAVAHEKLEHSEIEKMSLLGRIAQLEVRLTQ